MLKGKQPRNTPVWVAVVLGTLMTANFSFSQETTETEIILPDPIEILDDTLFVQRSSDLGSKDSQIIVSNCPMKGKNYLVNIA